MTILVERNGKTFVTATIDGPDEFVAPPLDGEAFPCLLWDHRGDSTHSDRSALSRRLLESGCRYVVCGGADCEAWHDREPLEDVASFFVMNSNFDNHDFTRYLVLHLGTSATGHQLDAAVRTCVLG